MSAPSRGSLWKETDAVDYMVSTGSDTHPSHDVVTERLAKDYAHRPLSMLDCGVMSGITYRKIHRDVPHVDYLGIDISEKILDDCAERFPAARWASMSIMDLALDDDSVDVAHARHVLESLPYYETAVRELFRVARELVVVSLFVIPRDPEFLMRRVTADGYLWLNRYAPGPLEALLDTLSEQVESIDVVHDHKAHRVYLCRPRSPGRR